MREAELAKGIGKLFGVLKKMDESGANKYVEFGEKRAGCVRQTHMLSVGFLDDCADEKKERKKQSF